MLHEVMQACLSTGRWDEAFLEEKIREVVQKGLGELMRINVSVEQAIIELNAKSKGLRVFGERYIAQSPKASSYSTVPKRLCISLTIFLAARGYPHQYAGCGGPNIITGYHTAARHRGGYLVA